MNANRRDSLEQKVAKDAKNSVNSAVHAGGLANLVYFAILSEAGVAFWFIG